MKLTKALQLLLKIFTTEFMTKTLEKVTGEAVDKLFNADGD